MDREEAVDRLRSARIGRLATVTRDARPHVVPLVFVLVEDVTLRLYWVVDDKPKRSRRLRRLANVEANPAVEVLVDRYDEDWRRLWWVRASGTSRVVDDPAEHNAALEALASKYPQYGERRPVGPVVAIDVGAISSWEAASPP